MPRRSFSIEDVGKITYVMCSDGYPIFFARFWNHVWTITMMKNGYSIERHQTHPSILRKKVNYYKY